MILYSSILRPDDETLDSGVIATLNRGRQPNGGSTLLDDGRTMIAGPALARERAGGIFPAKTALCACSAARPV